MFSHLQPFFYSAILPFFVGYCQFSLNDDPLRILCMTMAYYEKIITLSYAALQHDDNDDDGYTKIEIKNSCRNMRERERRQKGN